MKKRLTKRKTTPTSRLTVEQLKFRKAELETRLTALQPAMKAWLDAVLNSNVDDINI